MGKTIEAGAADAPQLEKLRELLLLEANYLQDSCGYQSQERIFSKQLFFLCRFPKFVFSDKSGSLCIEADFASK